MLQKIGKNLSMVFTEDGFTFGNCLLVEDDIRVILDSGAGNALWDIRPESIDMVINTHHHYDHIRGNHLFPNAKILMHPFEYEATMHPEKIVTIEGWQEFMHEDYMKYAEVLGIDPQDILQPWKVDDTVEDRQIIDCGCSSFLVLHTPGHCKGHLSFYFPEEELVFLGDICLTRVGPWYGEANVDITDFIASIDRILELKPKMVATSHVNKIITQPLKALTDYRDRIYKREQRILEFLKNRPCDIHELAEQKLIYKEHPTPFVLFWEKAMLKNHLKRLIAIGQVEVTEDGRYRALATA